MKLWQWFCRLGTDKLPQVPQPLTVKDRPMTVADRISHSGVDMVCTRICGSGGCRCGSTVRGLYCVWSYYRVE